MGGESGQDGTEAAMKKRLLGIAILALGLTTVGCATRGYRRYGPPPPHHRREVVVHVHKDRVWVPGHYRWDGHRYKWVKGRWVRAPRRGHTRIR